MSKAMKLKDLAAESDRDGLSVARNQGQERRTCLYYPVPLFLWAAILNKRVLPPIFCL